ncbi:MAG: prolyl oligopeptidase family serine peptidase [bacterium]
MYKDYVIDTPDGEKIRLSTFGSENAGEKHCIIYVHGFKGFKDWGFIPYTGNYFAERGFFFITFNFSLNGIGDNPTECTELQKFANNTFTREVSELSQVIDAYCSGFFGTKKNKKLGILGHSRGGAVSLLTSSIKKEVDAVAIWASISKLDRYTERQKKEWRKTGFVEIVNSRTNQVLRLNLSLLEDIEENKYSSLNMEKAVSILQCPLLIAHGDQDLSVPISEGEQLYEWSDKSKTEFYKLFAIGHTFDVVHPFSGSNEKFEKLLNKTFNFFSVRFIQSDQN